MIDFFLELARVKPNLEFQYSVELEPLSIALQYDREEINNLKDLPRERVSVPEQALLNILTNHPQKNGRYLIGRESQERVLFLLRDILPEQIKLPPEKPELKLKYSLEFTGQNCRVQVDLSGTGFSALRDVPKEKLTMAERAFINFLAGVPKNSGCFFVNQHQQAKMYYFLARVTSLTQNSGQRLKIYLTRPDYQAVFTARGGRYDFVLTLNGEILTKNNCRLGGEKNLVLLHKDTVYLLDNFSAFLFERYLLEPLSLTAAEAPRFLADCLPVLTARGLRLDLPKELAELNRSVVSTSAVPVLEILAEKNTTLRLKIKYDYGLKILPEYHSKDNADFYQIKLDNTEYFLKRDKKSEDWFHNYLLERRFNLEKTGYSVEHDDFVDFMTYEFPGLRKNIGLKVVGEKLEQYIYADQEFDVDLDFRQSSGIDWFEFTPLYKIKDDVFTHAQIQDLIDDEKEYVRLKDGSLVKIPQKEFAYLQSYLEGRSKKTASDKYEIKKYDLYYIYAGVRDQMKARVDSSLQALLTRLEDFSGIAEITLPAGIYGEPRQYQLQGYYWLKFLHDHDFHGVLADDMGLGKTLQVLLLFAHLKQAALLEHPALIVAPTSVIYNWVAEIKKFTPDLKILVLSGSRDRILKVKETARYDIVIASYALLRNDLEHYAKTEFSYMVLDEAQYIKNPKSQIARAVKCLNTRWRLALTGTPIENHLSELWSIFDFLMPGFLSTLSYFRAMYGEDYGRLQKKIHPFILRRTKAEVLKELPPKNEIDSFCELLPEQELIYRRVLQSQRKELLAVLNTTDIGKLQLNILACLLKLRQVCCHPALLKDAKTIVESAKFNQFKELLEEILENDSKVIVFSQFVEMLTIIRSFLNEQKLKYAYLDGSTKNRQEVIDGFNNNPELKIFLCSLKAGGLGINLTSANYVIIYDPWWNPAVEQQAMDRVYRIGQTKEVFVYKLITKGTVEEKILALQNKKRSLIDAVITSDHTAEKKITREELEELLTY